jgi:hypothetical protein
MSYMSTLDNRFESRVPLEMFLDTYVEDQPRRGFTVNISEGGLYLASIPQRPLPPRTPIGLAFALPGMSETIWAAGEVRFDDPDQYFCHRGIRFVGMARSHARMLREYLKRARLRRLFGLRYPLPAT